MSGFRAPLALSALLLAAALAGGCGSPASGSGRAAPGGYDPPINPSDFTTKVDNAWFPLKPGTTYISEGTEGRTRSRDVFTVTRSTRVVDGVRCVVIDDRVYHDGRLVERTSDYYAQHKRGAVWYFGEDTAELDRSGKVKSREGTWHAGVDGAKPGLFMPADPRVGERHRQEYYRGHAEDWYEVVSRDATIRVPYGTFRHALRTREWTPLEPGVVDAKYYARGIGQVAERTLRGGNERLALVKVIRR